MLIDTSIPSLSPTEAQEPAKHTMYVLVRRDIPIAQQVVQASHAAAEAGRKFYRAEHGIASLIVLTVPDLAGLTAARERLVRKDIVSETFFEPDFGIGESSLATAPLPDGMRKHLMGWPLWRLPEWAALPTQDPQHPVLHAA